MSVKRKAAQAQVEKKVELRQMKTRLLGTTWNWTSLALRRMMMILTPVSIPT